MSFFCDAGAIKLRIKRGHANVNVSISSVAAPCTKPALHIAAHVASASHGASNTGTPSNFTNRMTSWFCSLDTLTVRFAAFSIASLSPVSLATSKSFSAWSLLSFLFANSPPFKVGGFPSNTYTGLIPASSIRHVRDKTPMRCAVTCPFSSVN